MVGLGAKSRPSHDNRKERATEQKAISDHKRASVENYRKMWQIVPKWVWGLAIIIIQHHFPNHATTKWRQRREESGGVALLVCVCVSGSCGLPTTMLREIGQGAEEQQQQAEAAAAVALPSTQHMAAQALGMTRVPLQQAELNASLTYRALEPQDMPQLQALHAILFPVSYPDSFFKKATAPGSSSSSNLHSLGAFTISNELVGFLVFRMDRTCALDVEV